MRTRWYGYTGAALALVAGLSLAGPAFTQDGAQPPQPEVGASNKAAVTPEQRLEQAELIEKRASQLATRLAKMLSEARREKDIMRANCLNRKLTEVNANSTNITQRGKALKDAAAQGDEGRGNHEFTVLTVLSQKLSQLDQEAAQCLGQSVYEPGASQVITTVPANGPTVDPTDLTPVIPPSSPTLTLPPPLSGAD